MFCKSHFTKKKKIVIFDEATANCDKKAEAYKKYNNAAIVEMLIGIMPAMAKEISQSISKIDKINIYGGDGTSQVAGISPQVIHQLFDTMS